MRLGIGVDQDEVQRRVVVARIADDSAVVRVPEAHSTGLLHQRLGDGIIHGNLTRQQEAERGLSRAKKLRVLARDEFPCTGLLRVSETDSATASSLQQLT